MDRQKFERLTELYINTVYRIALGSCKNTHDAEDVTQDVFMKLWQSKTEYKDDEHVKRWLIRVTVNECNDLWRSPRRKKDLPLEEARYLPEFSSDAKKEIYQALMEIPIKYAQTAYLYYFEGYSVKETAEILKISQTAVQTRLQRAREFLRQRLKEDRQ